MAAKTVVFTYEIQLTKDGETWYRDPDQPPGMTYVPEPMPYADIAEQVYLREVDVSSYFKRTELRGVRVELWYLETIGAPNVPGLADNALAHAGARFNREAQQN